MRRKEPWFKFWAADFLTDPDVDELSLEAQGLLLRMWCVCSQRGNIPQDLEEIARLTRCKLQSVLKCYPQCKKLFELRQGSLFSARMEDEKAKSELARVNAEKRYRKETYTPANAKVCAIGAADGNAKSPAQKARKLESQSAESPAPESLAQDVHTTSSQPNSQAQPGIDAGIMARGLCERLNLSRQMGPGSVYMAVYDRAQIESTRGGSLENLCDRMVEAHESWLREDLKYRWGVAKFFGDGWWERPGAWPRKGEDSSLDKTARRAKKWDEFETKENDNAIK
jgi:hypothetical protein